MRTGKKRGPEKGDDRGIKIATYLLNNISRKRSEIGIFYE